MRGFWKGFGQILDGFWKDFVIIFFLILEGTSIGQTFQVEGLTSMIRATRGRSMDGSMGRLVDGWKDG